MIELLGIRHFFYVECLVLVATVVEVRLAYDNIVAGLQLVVYVDAVAGRQLVVFADMSAAVRTGVATNLVQAAGNDGDHFGPSNMECAVVDNHENERQHVGLHGHSDMNLATVELIRIQATSVNSDDNI